MLRTQATLKPGRPGTKRLLEEYGSRLICVRYRYDDERKTRCKTIEIVIEETPVPPPTRDRLPSFAPDAEVHVRVLWSEPHLRAAVRRHGARWHPPTRTWILLYKHALTLRLTDRIILHPKPTPPSHP